MSEEIGSDQYLYDGSLSKEDITQDKDEEKEPSTALSEEDGLENSSLFENNEEETVNLMNCASIHPIFWRQQTLD